LKCDRLRWPRRGERLGGSSDAPGAAARLAGLTRRAVSR
jgi:hypothetical protein